MAMLNNQMVIHKKSFVKIKQCWFDPPCWFCEKHVFWYPKLWPHDYIHTLSRSPWSSLFGWIYTYRVLDFRVVVFWWRTQGPSENAKTRKFKKTRCRWMHPKTRKFENPKSTKSKRKPRKRENLKIWKVQKKNEKTKTRKSEKCEK